MNDDKLEMNKQDRIIKALIVTYNHEIRNPLTVALGSLPKDPIVINEKTIRGIERARNALKRIVVVIEQLEKMQDKSKDFKLINYANSEDELVELDIR